jgi:hypothetical protein
MASSTGNSLYESLLGEDFNRLPMSIRQFHRRPHGATAKGVLTVRSSQSFLYRIFRLFLRLPPIGEEIPTQLCVNVRSGTEVWVRTIGGCRLETVQWRERDHLVEKIGCFQIKYRLSGGEEGMEFHFRQLRIGPLPLPPLIRVEATVGGDASFWHPRVRVLSPLFGFLFSYEGKMTHLP